MTFLADEGVDRQIVERLRLDGHEVSYVAEMAPGIMDEVVLRESRDSSSVLITADKDFGELVFRQRQASTGVLLVRLWVLSWTGHEGLGGLCRHSGTWARIAWGLCCAESWDHPNPSHAPSVGTKYAFISMKRRTKAYLPSEPLGRLGGHAGEVAVGGP